AIGLEALASGLPTFAIPAASYVREGMARPVTDQLAKEVAEALAGDHRPVAETVAAFLATATNEHLVEGSVQAIGPDLASQLAVRIRAMALVATADA
ncbi:MAG: hypothetical protein ACYC2K_06335, partial [Gemmatimonadales bacterium]